MKFIETNIEDLFIIEPTVIKDDRGYFLESHNQNKFEEAIGKVSFVQDNESKTSKGVIRGLHFQLPPYDQAKLIRCIEGKVLDVAVDLRKGSKTYGQHISVEISCKNKKQIFIPRGFAHGFLVLSEFAIFAYKVDNFYSPDYDAGLFWNDPILKINWGIDESKILLSNKDSKLPFFSDFKSPFNI
tara:strand:- start:156 stop:710 length:555 start_codon:yes stop_codon:yes gene_type:complete